MNTIKPMSNLKNKIIDFGWQLLMDRQPIKKLHSQPDVYFIRLPFERGYFYIDVFVKAGASVESKQQAGIGHLLEHYLAGFIEAKYDDGIDLSVASINDNYLVFGLNARKDEPLEKPVNWFLDNLFRPDFGDQNLFDYEKQSIINELTTQAQDLDKSFARLVRRNRYKDEPNQRVFIDHLDSIPTLTLDDLTSHHRKYFSRDNTVIFISSATFEEKKIHKLMGRIKAFELANNASSWPEPEYSDFLVKFENKDGIKGQYASLSFPAPGLLSDYRERLILSMIRDWLTGSEKDSGFLRARRVGIYKFRFYSNYNIKSGYLELDTYLTGNQLAQWLQIVNSSLSTLKQEGLPKDAWNRIKNRFLLDEKNDWRNNRGRFQTLAGSIIEQGKALEWPEIKQLIKNLSMDDICMTAKKFFDRDKTNLTIYGQRPQITEQEILKLLNF